MSEHFHGRNFRPLRANCVSGNQALSSSGVKFVFGIKTADMSLNFTFATRRHFSDTVRDHLSI